MSIDTTLTQNLKEEPLYEVLNARQTKSTNRENFR